MAARLPLFRLALGLALLAGAVLRLWNLPRQILGGDEVHGVRAALGMPLGEIVTTFARSDHSIPLAAYDRLLLLAGVELTETLARLPPLLAGIAALALLPWVARPRLGPRGSLLLAALVAISPSLVIYSRIARPYMPAVLFAFLAVLAFDAWWRGEGRSRGALYALCAPLTVVFLPVAAPFVAAPPLLAAGELLVARGRWGEEGRRRWRRLFTLGAVTLAGLALLCGPALPSFLRLAAEKGGSGRLRWETVAEAVQLQAGSGEPLVALLFWAAVVWGLAVLLRRERRLLLFTAAPALVQVAAVIATAPYGMADPVTCNRYLLVLQPVLLTWIAAGLTWPAGAAPAGTGRWAWAGPRARFAAAVLLPAALFVGGPLVEPAWRRTSFTVHNDFVAFSRPRPRMQAEDVPAAYRWLPAPGPVLEFPWPWQWRGGSCLHAYEELHGRRVLVSSPGLLFADPRVSFRNAVQADPQAFLASGARYLLVHRNLPAEERMLLRQDRLITLPGEPETLRQAGVKMLRRLRRQWGPPAYDDGRVAVWDLAVVSARPRPAPGRGGS